MLYREIAELAPKTEADSGVLQDELSGSSSTSNFRIVIAGICTD
jgi:hypothetical protein